jgi:predicted secreted protein
MYDTPPYRRFCYQLAEQASEQVRMYRQVGARMVCILGVEGSPNCGVNFTPQSGDWGGRPEEMPMEQIIVPGRGVFMEEIDRRLREDKSEPVPILGLSLEDLKKPMSEILEELEAFLTTCLETHAGARN